MTTLHTDGSTDGLVTDLLKMTDLNDRYGQNAVKNRQTSITLKQTCPSADRQTRQFKRLTDRSTVADRHGLKDGLISRDVAEHAQNFKMTIKI